MNKYIELVNVLSVKSLNGSNYVYPNQENLGDRSYPLARVLYIVNCQGYEGLGMGFSSFIAGELGQRIITTSGLSPMREPSRNIRIRNQIENDKK
jgi:phosphate transport system substrate-binding protein